MTTDHLRDSILDERRKQSELEKQNSYLKIEVIKGQEKLRDVHNVISNLNCDIQNHKKEVLLGENKQKETEIIKDEMSSKFNRDIENNERIRKEYSVEVKGLNAEITNLKSQVTSSDSLQINCKVGW